MTGEFPLLIGLFLFVFTAVAAVGYFYLTRQTQPAAQASPVLADTESGSARALVIGAIKAVGEALPAAQEADNPVRRELAAAGYRYPSALPIFYGIKAALAVLLSAVLGLAAYLNGADLSAVFLAMLGGAGIGYLLPDRLLRPLIGARAERIRRAIPAALDLMVLSVEAGQSLNLAILDTANELRAAFPDLSAELAQVHLELRAGKSRSEALYHLGERNAEPELRKLANVLLDSDRFGTSLAPALRTHARYLRTRMKQQAQESARRVAVKLVFPVFFLIFPSVLLVTLGPAVIKMMAQLRAFMGQ